MDTRIKATYRISPDGIYCGMETDIGLQFIFSSTMSYWRPYNEVFPQEMQVKDSGGLNYWICPSIAPIKREKLRVKL